MTTTAPPRQVTDEADAKGLELARQAGDAYQRMVEHFLNDIATGGAIRPAGDYLIGVATEQAEPLWHLLGGRLQLKEPAPDLNCHLEVVVMDAADHRFIPGLEVNVTLSRDGQELGTHRLPMLWHPTMFHYGRSVHVQDEGQYAMTVCIEAPNFGRHDKTNGRRYGEPVTVTYEGIQIRPGRKL